VRWIETFVLAVVLGSLGCDEPDFLECDGGTVEEVGGTARCVYGDAGAPGGDGGGDGGGPSDGGADAGRDGGEVPEDAGRVLADAPDCVRPGDCPFDVRSVLDLTEADEVSVVERIDGEDHAIPTACGDVTSTDRDVFRIRAPVRTRIEIEVVPDDALEPILEGFGTNLGSLATFAGSSGTTRMVMISPAPPPEGITLQLHHSAAYGSLCSGTPPTFRGGDAYGYTITARVCEDCPLEELGPLGGGSSATAALDAPGEARFFRFTAPEDADPEVTVSLSGACPAALSGACCPIVVPLTPGGDEPLSVRSDYTATTGRTCDGDTQRFGPTNPTGERLFAVYDFEGLGAPGYEVAVSVAP